MNFFLKLFDTSGFPPRWQCGSGWTAGLGWTHILADLATFGAYFAIPVLLIYFIRNRRDMPFPKLFWLFGLFIFSCGTVHLIEAIIFWEPIYRFSALIKVITAVASWATVLVLVPILPRALALPGLEKVNQDLLAAQARLQEAEKRYEDLFENSPDLYVSVDAKSRIVLTCNQTLANILGYSKEEVIGHPVTNLYYRDSVADAQRAFSRFLAGEPVQDVELRLKKKDDSVIDVSLNVSAIRDASGQIIASRSVWRDITKMKQTQAALNRSQRLASVGTLAAGIAHEINNPLGAILMGAYHAKNEIVKINGESISTQQTLDQIIEDTQRCSRILKNVLQFARDDSSDKWADDPTDVIEASCRLTRHYLSNRDVQLIVDVKDSVALAVFNPTEIEQVLINAIRNAVAAHATVIRISTRVDKDAGHLWIDVKDDGTGLSEEHARRVFDPFFTTRQKEGGTGLGLSIAHGIIAEHGGTILLQNHAEGGAVLSFSLPLASPEDIAALK